MPAGIVGCPPSKNHGGGVREAFRGKLTPEAVDGPVGPVIRQGHQPARPGERTRRPDLLQTRVGIDGHGLTEVGRGIRTPLGGGHGPPRHLRALRLPEKRVGGPNPEAVDARVEPAVCGDGGGGFAVQDDVEHHAQSALVRRGHQRPQILLGPIPRVDGLGANHIDREAGR